MSALDIWDFDHNLTWVSPSAPAFHLQMVPNLLCSCKCFSIPSSQGHLNNSGGGERKSQGDKPDVILGERVDTMGAKRTPIIYVLVIFWVTIISQALWEFSGGFLSIHVIHVSDCQASLRLPLLCVRCLCVQSDAQGFGHSLSASSLTATNHALTLIFWLSFWGLQGSVADLSPWHTAFYL